MSRHCWTIDEMVLFEQLWPNHSAAEIAMRIYGTTDAGALRGIYRMAGVIGIRKWPHWPREVLRRVRQLHAEGLNDADIGRRMTDVFTSDDPRRQATAVRSRLGLPVNIEAAKAAGRRAVESQRKSLGIRHGGDLRALGYRNFAIENGWPADCRPREVQILNILAVRGVPLTMREIAAAIGTGTAETWSTGSRRLLLAGNGPGGTYTASLARRGLVTRLICAGPRKGPGKRRNLDLYCLGPAALSILKERARCLSNETPSASTTPAS